MDNDVIVVRILREDVRFIRCKDSRLFWRPNRAGYGPLSNAGVYSLEEATNIRRGAPEKVEIMTPSEAVAAAWGVRTQRAFWG